MKPYILDAKVRGELYPPDRLGLLTQDMLEVELPGKVFVDVGWYPEHDSAGEYVVIIFAGNADNLLMPPIRTRCFEEALVTVLDLSARFRGPVSLTSGSATTHFSEEVPVPSPTAA